MILHTLPDSLFALFISWHSPPQHVFDMGKGSVPWKEAMMTDTPQKHHQEGAEKKMQDVLAITLSRLAMLKIGAVPNRCFDNAWRTFFSLPEAVFEGRQFVEGWIVFDLEAEVVLNEHGWCELSDGTIVDPSLLLLVEPT